LHLPEIVALRSKLVPELPLYAVLPGGPDQLALAGRADAIAFDNGQASVVLDWKSDIAPTSQDIRIHTSQLRHYMVAIDAPHGALVYMTLGAVHWYRHNDGRAAKLLWFLDPSPNSINDH
jgi:CRISPR-associated exonuclease Cas4